MSFIVEDKGGSFERCPPGMHLARCYRVIDVGSQKSEYMGEVKIKHQISLGWEIHGSDDDGQPLLMKDGRPFGIFKNYTLSWGEKANLRLDLQAWRGKAFTQEEMRRFDLATILGAWCMLNVIERQGSNGKTYSNVNSVTPVPAVIKQNGLPPAVNQLEMFNLATPDMKLFDTFSKHLQDKIMQSPEWQKINGVTNPPVANDGFSTPDFDDDIPF
jgi:hypothetical protein